MRLVREVGEKELYELWRGTIEGIARAVERAYEFTGIFQMAARSYYVPRHALS